jgi:hypothetical protein
LAKVFTGEQFPDGSLVNIRFPLIEEPELEKRFEDSYLKHKKNVPRGVPVLLHRKEN